MDSMAFVLGADTEKPYPDTMMMYQDNELINEDIKEITDNTGLSGLTYGPLGLLYGVSDSKDLDVKRVIMGDLNKDLHVIWKPLNLTDTQWTLLPRDIESVVSPNGSNIIIVTGSRGEYNIITNPQSKKPKVGEQLNVGLPPELLRVKARGVKNINIEATWIRASEPGETHRNTIMGYTNRDGPFSGNSYFIDIETGRYIEEYTLIKTQPQATKESGVRLAEKHQLNDGTIVCLYATENKMGGGDNRLMVIEKNMIIGDSGWGTNQIQKWEAFAHKNINKYELIYAFNKIQNINQEIFFKKDTKTKIPKDKFDENIIREKWLQPTVVNTGLFHMLRSVIGRGNELLSQTNIRRKRKRKKTKKKRKKTKKKRKKTKKKRS